MKSKRRVTNKVVVLKNGSMVDYYTGRPVTWSGRLGSVKVAANAKFIHQK